MDLDDLLADTPKVTAPVDVDDLLGNLLSAEENTAGVAGAHAGDSISPFDGSLNDVEIPSLRRAPDGNTHLTPLYPVSIRPFRQPPAHVKTYVTNTCYYANQVTIVSNGVNREKRGLVVSESSIYIMSDNIRVLKTIPLTQIESLIMQDMMTTKSLGLSKEMQTYVLLQLRDLPDLLFVLSEDKKKDPTTGRPYGESIPPLDIVLQRLLLSYEIDLPVCRLGENESIAIFIKGNVTDRTMRRKCAEALAYRTRLLDALKNLSQRNNELTSARNKIEASSASLAVKSLLKEAENIEEKKKEITLALQQTDISIDKCRQKEEELRESIKELEENRQAVVRQKVAEQESEKIARQAVEFELMQQSHKTEMRNFNLLRTFLQARTDRCRRSPPVSAGEIEADVVELQRLLGVVASRKDAAMESLTEVKRRLYEAKAALQKVTNEVEVLQQLPQGGEIPQDFNRDMAPTFASISLPDDELCVKNTDVAVVATSRGGNNASNGRGTLLVLSDEDDDIDIALLPQRPQNSQKKPPIILDDDDL